MPARKPSLPPAGRDRVLAASLDLFAEAGFSGVSMRDVAAAVGVTPAALYHHFPDKEALYLAVVAHLYNDRIPVLMHQAMGEGEPWQRLERLVAGVIRMSLAEPRLLRLSQWVLLDTDPARTQKLADNVFRPFLDAVTRLARELGGGFDPHRLAVSVLALLVFPFHADTVMRHMPGHRSLARHANAQAQHVVALLRHGIAGEGRA